MVYQNECTFNEPSSWGYGFVITFFPNISFPLRPLKHLRIVRYCCCLLACLGFPCSRHCGLTRSGERKSKPQVPPRSTSYKDNRAEHWKFIEVARNYARQSISILFT